MTEKLRDCFDEMVVYKDLKKSNFFSALGLPSFLRDWLLKKFADDEGNLDIDELTDFIHTYLPNKEEWIRIKDRIINDNERVKILTKISVDISIKTGEITYVSFPFRPAVHHLTAISNPHPAVGAPSRRGRIPGLALYFPETGPSGNQQGFN